jgi:hypothetical protein
MSAITIQITGDASGLVAASGQAEASLTRLEGSAQRSSGVLGSMGSALGSVAFGAAVAGAGALAAGLTASVSSAMSFEKQMSAVGAVAGASGAQMQQLTQLALQLGKDTSFSASEAAAGMEEIIKAGMSVEQVLGGSARAVLDLSSATGTEVEESARIMSNALNTFKADNMSATDAANLLAGAANASATSVHELGYGLASVGNVAATMGLSFTDTSTALALFAQNGLKGSDAGTSLKTMLLNLQPTTKAQIAEFNQLGLSTFDAQKAMEVLRSKGIEPVSEDSGDLVKQLLQGVLGIQDFSKATKEQQDSYSKLITSTGILHNEFFDQNGQMKSLADVSQILQTSLAGLTKQQQIAALETLFGTDAIRAAAIMAKEGSEGFNAMGTAMKEQGDTAKMSETRLANLAGSLEKLKGSLETAAIMIGGLMTPALKTMVDAITDGVNAAIPIIEQLPDIWRTVGQVFMNDWSPDDAIDPLVNAVGKAAIAFRDFFGVSRLISDLSAIVAKALGGDMAGAFTSLLTLIGRTTAGIVTQLAAWGRAFVEWIAPMVGPALSALGAFIGQVLAWAAQQIGPLATQLALWATAFVEWVTPAVPPLMAALATLATGIVTWIGENGPIILATLAAWGLAFVDWVAPAIPPLLAALGTLLTGLATWATTTALPAIVTALLTWGTAFMQWVIDATPPLMAALATLLVALGAWITTTALPAIATALVTWGAAFMEWVPVAWTQMLTALGVMLGQFVSWLASTGLPQIQTGLAAWGAAMSQWIIDSGPTVLAALGGLILIILTEMQKLPAQIMEAGRQAGVAIVTGMIEGAGGSVGQLTSSLQSIFAQAIGAAWEGAKRMVPGLGSVANLVGMSNPGGGGGGGGSLGAGNGANPNVMRYSKEIAAAAAKYNINPSDLAGLVDLESSGNPNARSGAGAMGLGQVMPFHFAAGEDPYDPQTNLNAAARVYRSNLDKYGGDPIHAAAGYFGAGDNLNASDGGATGNDYIRIFQERRQRYQTTPNAAGPGGMMKVPLGGGGNPMAPMDGGPLPPFMQETFDSLPDYQKSLDTIQQLGTSTYTDVAGVAKEQGLVLAGSQTDALGNVTSVYRSAGGELITTTTDTSGQVTSQYATLAGGVTVAMGDLSAGVTTTQTELGNNLMTMTTDAAGNYVTTITDMSGQIISQYAGLAGGVMLATEGQNTAVTTSYDLMAQGSLQHVQALADGTTATVSSASGVTVTTITDMQGNVVNQYGTMADGTAIRANDMATRTTSTTDAMAGTVKTTMTDMAGNVVTTVTTMSGEVVSVTATASTQQVSIWGTTSQQVIAAASNMGLQVIGQSRTMASGIVTATKDGTGQMVTLVTDATGKVIGQFKELSDSGKIVASGMDVAAKGLDAVIKKMKDAESQAKKTSDAMGSLGGKQGGGGSSKAGAPAKAAGGSVFGGTQYLVGERGPELFTPSTGGYITPNERLRSGDVIDYDRLAAAIARVSGKTYSLTVNTQASHEPIVQDFALLESLSRSGS